MNENVHSVHAQVECKWTITFILYVQILNVRGCICSLFSLAK